MSTVEEAPDADDGAPEGSDEPIVELKPFEAEAFFSQSMGDSPLGDAPPSPPDSGGSFGAASAVDVEDVDLPEIPGYHLEGIIGRGATGVVYRARQSAVDRAVALKVLHQELIANPRAVKRLKREARLAAKLAHPSIISAIDMGSVGGLWWYAMELVEGMPLSRRIAERRSLSERECLRLFSPLCDALQHAHEVGVVHRDIKPANILIDQRGRARLVDLGLAMSENDPSITKTGSTLGTPHYVSPEQARDPSQADIRSDLWSLGATIYHAACGQPPFHTDDADGRGVAEILTRVLYMPVIDPREFAPGLSKGFALMLRKCLTRDPDQRYQEPWELVADIELLRERRRVDAGQSQLDAYASRRPPWFRSARLAAGVLAIVGATWLLTARPWEPPPPAPEPQRQAELGDWPELQKIRDEFESGALKPADALAELDSPSLGALPDGALFLRNKLRVAVREALDRRLAGCLESGSKEIEEALAARQFASAFEFAGGGFREGLYGATGYRTMDQLPTGSSKRRAIEWRDATLSLVRAEHREAIRAAEAALGARYTMLLRQELDPRLASNRWRDALEWLSPAEPLTWLDRARALGGGGAADIGSALILTGLDRPEQREIVRAIDGRIRSAASDVRFRVNEVLRDARDFVAAQRLQLLEGIEDAILREEATAAARFDRALEAKHASDGLDLEQLPEELARAYGDELRIVREELSDAERRMRERLASQGIRALESRAQGPLSRRDYGAVRAMYEEARGESWRASTVDVIDARLRETELLEDVLAAAARGIEALSGKKHELTFGQIPRQGRIEGRSGEVRRLGFHFVPEFRSGSRMLIVLGRSGAPIKGLEDREARLLETGDVLELAGLSDFPELGPKDALRAAAFLAAEGQHGRARALIRLEDQGADATLAADLERRTRRKAGVEPPSRGTANVPGSAAQDTETAGALRSGAGESPRDRADASFQAVFGTPNQSRRSAHAELVWRFAEDSVAGGVRLRSPLGRGIDSLGAWNPRTWVPTPDGLQQFGLLPEVQNFVRDEVGPTLALQPPLDTSRRMRLELEIVPGVDRPNGHVFAVSFRGYHTLIAGTRVWFGGGNLRELYGYARRNGRGDFPGFDVRTTQKLVEGRPTTLVIEIGEGALDRLDIGGKSAGFTRFQEAPEHEESFVRVRSLCPMTLRSAVLVGDRVK